MPELNNRKTMWVVLSASCLLSFATIAWLQERTRGIAASPQPRTSAEHRAEPDRSDGSAPPASRAPETAAGVTGAIGADDAGTRIAAAGSAPGAAPIGAARHKVRRPDFESLLDAHDSYERASLAAFNERYRGALHFDSAAEFRWLEENGYPLPEEILAAASMGLDELRERAAGGDPKAEFLYFDRLNQEVVRARDMHAGSGLPAHTLIENPDFAWLFVEADTYRSRLADNASPFSGYLLAGFYENALGNPHAAASALYHAGLSGDPVAMRAADSLTRRHGIGAEARDALAASAIVLHELGGGHRPSSPRPDGW